jgi:hypothetical protein
MAPSRIQAQGFPVPPCNLLTILTILTPLSRTFGFLMQILCSKNLNRNQGKASRPCASCASCGKSTNIGFFVDQVLVQTAAQQRPWQPIPSTIFRVPKSRRFDSLVQMCAYLCMRTTIELPDPLFRSARAAAHERGMTLKELFTEALDRALKSPVKGPKRMDQPPVSGGAGRRIPARTNKELAEILAEDEFFKAR